MPFDPAGFNERPEPPKSNDRMAIFLIVTIAISALVTPISLEACVDTIRYVMGK